MKLIKALNNNVALVKDKNGQEAVVMGKGVGFGIKNGCSIPESLIEKHFILNSDSGKRDFDKLLRRITVDDIELASDIIREGENMLGYRCNDSILLTLSDHLGMLLERMKEGIHFGTPLEWDIRLIYPREYQFAKKVVEDLREKTGYEIPEQEVAFIVLHFINANSSQKGMEETMIYTKIIQNILNISKLHYGREFKEDNFDVSRFVTHVRYFVKRQMNGEKLEMDKSIAEVIARRCPEDHKCARKITRFLKQAYGWEVSEGEELYLTLHLNRMNIQ